MYENRARSHTHEEMLRTAKASPEAVARHDRQAWLELFSRRAIVEDPVGSSPAVCIVDEKTGVSDISRLEKFYDTFIAPNDIIFHVYQDIVADHLVIRDTDIEINSVTGLNISVHTYVLYEFAEEVAGLKIARLAAHWELAGMVRQVLSRGWPGLKMMAFLGIRMIRVQGLGGVFGYMRGFRGVGRRGKERLQEFSRAVNERDRNSIIRLFQSGGCTIEFPANGRAVDPGSLLEVVTGGISISAPIASGSATGFRFDAIVYGFSRRGIGLFEFGKGGRVIERARLFWEES